MHYNNNRYYIKIYITNIAALKVGGRTVFYLVTVSLPGGNMVSGSVGFIMETQEHFQQARGGCPTGELYQI